MASKEKNGKIELMRFVFCLTILFRHINHDLWDAKKTWGGTNFTFFKYGVMGVEFFFLLSGFLMAGTIFRRLERENTDASLAREDLGTETVKFLARKVKGILPYHVIACVLMILIGLTKNPVGYLKKLVKAAPSLLFLQRFGLGDGQVLNVEWYIGSMLFAMLILYPICRKYYSVFSRVAAPAISLLLVGYLIHETGSLDGSGDWLGWTYKCNIRAIADICLGIVCFEICRIIRGRRYKLWQRVLFSATEFVCYLFPILFMCSPLDRKYESYVAASLAIAITLSFAETGVFGGSVLFRNRFCRFLGAISLPVYLIQNITRVLVMDHCSFLPSETQAVLITGLTVLSGCLLYYIVGTARKKRMGKN